MSNIVANRSEILFLYDIRDGNPNGDPLDENKPRIDEETSTNLVTDVRLKRTIRDYLHNFKGKEIFVREIIYNEAEKFIQDGKRRAKNFDENAERILNECIDVRLFGGVIPLTKDSITYTGPVQFKMGRSLHRVVMKHIKGTGAFASKDNSKQATFREEDILPYSLILFYGLINENAANYTKLTEEDIPLLLDGIWNGTKSLISRSKVGQNPRLLIKINYSKENYHIGDIDRMVRLVSDIPDETIRDIGDVQLDLTPLINKLQEKVKSIKDVEILVDDRVRFVFDGSNFAISDLAKATGVTVKAIAF
jgi:CRISPR-associated protein Csh2